MNGPDDAEKKRSAPLLTRDLLAILHYVRASFMGDPKLGRVTAPHRRLALAKKPTLEECSHVVGSNRNRDIGKSRRVVTRCFLRVEEELEYLRLFFIQPAINAFTIIQLRLKIRNRRRHIANLLLQLRDRDILLDELLLKSADMLLQHAKLKNKAINMGLLSASDSELGSKVLDCGEVDHGSEISSANSLYSYDRPQ